MQVSKAHLGVHEALSKLARDPSAIFLRLSRQQVGSGAVCGREMLYRAPRWSPVLGAAAVAAAEHPADEPHTQVSTSSTLGTPLVN